jgi:hypothetical protein
MSSPTRAARFTRLARIVGLCLIALLALNATLSLAGAAPGPQASVPLVFNFQGLARDAEGKPLASDQYSFTFRLYDSMTATADIWHETQDGVAVRDGRFSATLGVVTAIPADAFSSPDRFIGVTVAGGQELQPRQRISSVPYAFNAALLGGQSASAFAPAQHSHDASAITGGELPDARVANQLTLGSGSTINNTPIGQSGPNAAKFTDVSANTVTASGFMQAAGITSNAAVNIRPAAAGGNSLLINGRRPFLMRSFNIGDVVYYKTDIPANDYACAVSGFNAVNGDIYEGGARYDGDTLVMVFATTQDGFWWIDADFRSHNQSETWSVGLLCIDRSLVTY